MKRIRESIDEINEQKEEKIEKEIEGLLFRDKEIPFEKLLKNLTEKNILTSRTTLAKYLDQLHKKKRIEYHTNPKNKRETLYCINPLYFDRSPLYPVLIGSVIYRQIVGLWMERLGELRQKDAEQPIENLIIYDIKNLENDLGQMFLIMLAMDIEKKGIFKASIESFIDFFHDLMSEAPDVVSAIKNRDPVAYSGIEKEFVLPYDKIEKKFLNMMDEDLRFNETLTPDLKEVSIEFQDHFYKKLDFPFSEEWEKKKKKQIV